MAKFVSHEKWLGFKGLLWITPFAILALPFAVAALACDYAEDAATWLRRKTDKLNDKVQDELFPPTWWPSHKVMEELNEIRATRRKAQVDRLHSRVARKENT